ncbi:hypothetical protein PG984_010963 [Apiospora sp. TS-2023a]
MRLVSLLLLLGTLCELSYQIGFARPSFVVPLKTGSYGANMVWKVGDVERIEFDTPWPEYKIEFWQQSLVAGGALLASKLVYQQARGEQLPQVINWTVSTGDLDASLSPVFFFWLREISDSKDKEPASQSSAYFNITERPVEASPTSTQSPSSKTPTSTSSSSISSLPSTATSDTSISQPTVTDNNRPSGAASDQNSSYQQPSGLSTGATAGIGVGVGIAAIAAIACAIMVFMNRRKGGERDTGPGSGVSSMPPLPNQAQQQQQQPYYYPPQYGMVEPFAPNGPPKGFTLYESSPQTVQELSDNRIYSSELPADQGWVHSQTPVNQR